MLMMGVYTSGQWDGHGSSRGHRRGATKEKVKLGSTRAVGRADCGGEMDEVAGGQVGGLEDWELDGGDLVDSEKKGLQFKNFWKS